MFEWNEKIRGEAITLPSIAQVVEHFVEPGMDSRTREERLIELVGELAAVLLPGQQDRFVEALGYHRVVPAPPPRLSWFEQNPEGTNAVTSLNYSINSMNRAEVIAACMEGVHTYTELMEYRVQHLNKMWPLPSAVVAVNNRTWQMAAYTADTIAQSILRDLSIPDVDHTKGGIHASLTALSKALANDEDCDK